MTFDFQEWIMIVLALVIAIPIHEFSHALSAVLCGDDGPRRDGRLSIMPWDHFDPMGAMCCLVSAAAGFGIGWGKPVLVNPNVLRNPKWDMCQIAAWGPLSNFLLAVLFALPLRYQLVQGKGLQHLLEVCLEVNLGLMLFNLLPIGPLDGAKIVVAFLPDAPAYAFSRFQAQWGMRLLFGLILLGPMLFGGRILEILIGIPEERLAQLLLGGG